MKEPKKLSWKPRRRGAIYCAPACGRGCTHNEYLAAVRDAKALAKELGEGWKVRVTENLGWHFSAYRDHIQVHPSVNGWFALISDDWNGPGGNVEWTDAVDTRPTPKAAVKAAIKRALGVIHRYEQTGKTLECYLNEM